MSSTQNLLGHFYHQNVHPDLGANFEKLQELMFILNENLFMIKLENFTLKVSISRDNYLQKLLFMLVLSHFFPPHYHFFSSVNRKTKRRYQIERHLC